MSEKPTNLPSTPAPKPSERKDGLPDIFRRDFPKPTQPLATPKPPVEPKRETIRTGPKKGG